jgi:tetratricopeptide (TPR) repeat protein
MRDFKPILLAALASSALGGCAGRDEKVGVRLLQPTDGAVPGSPDALVAAGRQSLERQHYGLAISQFRTALQGSETSAAAHNGLAIAYASLGRVDLARRHFELAMAHAPGDESYRRNFARLAGAEAPRGAAGAASMALAEAGQPPQSAPAPNSVVSVVPGVSMLRTAGAQGPSTLAVVRRTFGTMLTSARPLLQRIGLSQVRLHTAGAVIAAPAEDHGQQQAAGKTPYNLSIGRAAFSSAVERSRRRAAPAVSPLSFDRGCGGASPYAWRSPRPLPVVISIAACPA